MVTYDMSETISEMELLSRRLATMQRNRA